MAAKGRAERGDALDLGAEPGIRDVATLHGKLLARVHDRGAVAIDASRVRRVDTSTLQVLAAFARDRMAAGRELCWTGVSTPFAQAASRLGLTEALALDAAPECEP